MIKGLKLWGVLFSCTLGGAFYAASSGYGVPQPSKNPMSIREGSMKVTSDGRKARYFYGGGIHSGK